MFLPSPSDLLVNLNEARGLIHQLLEELPGMFKDTNETTSALGAALQVNIFGLFWSFLALFDDFWSFPKTSCHISKL